MKYNGGATCPLIVKEDKNFLFTRLSRYECSIFEFGHSSIQKKQHIKEQNPDDFDVEMLQYGKL